MILGTYKSLMNPYVFRALGRSMDEVHSLIVRANAAHCSQMGAKPKLIRAEDVGFFEILPGQAFRDHSCLVDDAQGSRLAGKVREDFFKLAEVCEHRDGADCTHPNIEFDRMTCCTANCPLLLEEE